MKKKRNKPTIKELRSDVDKLFNVMGSINYTTDTLRILLENYLEMKKDTEKLAKFMEAKTEKLKDEISEDTQVVQAEDSE